MAKKTLAGTAQAYIEGGLLKISVRVEHIPDIIVEGLEGGHLSLFAETGARVTDVDRFAKDVCNALNHEREDGTTPVHELFDSAFEKAVEDGSIGVEFPRPKRKPKSA